VSDRRFPEEQVEDPDAQVSRRTAIFAETVAFVFLAAAGVLVWLLSGGTCRRKFIHQHGDTGSHHQHGDDHEHHSLENQDGRVLSRSAAKSIRARSARDMNRACACDRVTQSR
jgi:ABC-type nickel/cobalt efflux system permease component RcnA